MRTYRHGGAETANPGEWLQLDLGQKYHVHVVQINFADDKIDIPVPGKIRGTTQGRYIDETDYVTRWKLEGSLDGETYFVVEDKSDAGTDLPHDLVIKEDGICVRYLRLTIYEIPYAQKPCISGLRVFGTGNGEKPAVPEFLAKRISDMDMKVTIQGENAVGYNILWGSSPEKLYHSFMAFDTEQIVGALVAGREYYIRVDAFNENGITKGNIIKLV